MKQSEKRAAEAYPETLNLGRGRSMLDVYIQSKEIYIEGYEQAEKDLGWHSVDESLPEETEYVTDNGCHQKWSKSVFVITTGNSVMLCWTKDGEFFCDKDFHFPVKVKYWMPCPKLPEK